MKFFCTVTNDPLRVEWPQILEITFHFCDVDHEGMDAEPSAEKITALGEKGSIPLGFFSFLTPQQIFTQSEKIAFVHQGERKSSACCRLLSKKTK